MALSRRAQTYLSRLPRGPYASREAVSAASQRAGYTPYDAWLEFQDRFGGYQESLGREMAVWGVVHADSYWLLPNEAAIYEDHGQTHVVCAESHPSYEYQLYSTGKFFSSGGGGQCESFDVKVERDAIVMSRIDLGVQGWWTHDPEILVAAENDIDRVLEWIGGELVPEASDGYATCAFGKDAVIVVRRKSCSLWTTDEARARLTQTARVFAEKHS